MGIEDLRFIKISNGWILTITDKGIMKETVEDIYFKDKNEIIKWIKENVNG